LQEIVKNQKGNVFKLQARLCFSGCLFFSCLKVFLPMGQGEMRSFEGNRNMLLANQLGIFT